MKRKKRKGWQKVGGEREALLRDINEKPAGEWKYPRVGLFVPLGHNVQSSCFLAMMEIQRAHGLPFLKLPRALQLDMSRTRACEAMLRSEDLTHILMLDADHDHRPDVVQRLARWVVATRGQADEVEVVAGLNFSRSWPHKPCCFVDELPNQWDCHSTSNLGVPTQWPEEGLMQVAIAGTGSMLIARTALERIARPFFWMPDRWNCPQAKIAWPGEDVGFAIRCREAGVRQFVDVTCSSPHLSYRWITGEDFDPAALDQISKGEHEKTRT